MGWFSKAVSFVKNNASGIVHGVLDVAGFIPVVGAVADLANAAVYAAEGDYVNAALSAVSAIPGVGDAVAAASKTVKVVSKGVKLASNVKQGVRALDKIQDGLKVIKGKCTTGGSLLKKGKDDIKAIFDKIKKNAKKKSVDGKPCKPKKTKSTQNKPEGSTKGCGDPVNIVTGSVFFEEEDFDFPGYIPVQWERRYYSDNRRAGMLGRGNILNYETNLHVLPTENRIDFLLPDGRMIELKHWDENTPLFVRNEKITITKTEEGYQAEFHDDKLYYIYSLSSYSLNQYQLKEIRNRAGHTIFFHYQGRVLDRIIDSAGRELCITSDGKGRITQVRYKDRILVTYVYNNENNLIRSCDALKQTSKYYYLNHLLCKRITKGGYSFYWEYDDISYDAKCIHTWGENGVSEYWFEYADGSNIITSGTGYSYTVFYDNKNLIRKFADGDGNVTEFLYNGAEEVIAVIDPMGNKTSCEYDRMGNVMKYIRPSGLTISYVYGEDGNEHQIIYPNGGVVTYEYNKAGGVTKVIQSDNSEIRYNYNSEYLIEMIEYPDGKQIKYNYDSYGNITEVLYPDGSRELFQYDSYGCCIQMTDRQGGVFHMEYDVLDRLVKMSQPDGTVTHMEYNEYDELVRYKDQQRTIQAEYTWSGKLKKRTEGTRVLELFYDIEEKLEKIKNEAGEYYYFERNATGQLVKEIGFDGILYEYEHDKAGRITKLTIGGNQAREFQYDKDSNLIQIQYSDGRNELFEYNEMGSVSVIENGDSRVEYEFDSMNRVVGVNQDGITLEYEYDSLAQRTSIKSSLGAKIEQSYTCQGGVGELKASCLSFPQWNAEMSYNPIGQVLSRKVQGGITNTWEYDRMGHLVFQSTYTGEEERKRKYVWGINHQLKTIESGRRKISYTYDTYGHLKSAAYDSMLLLRILNKTGNIYETEQQTDRLYGKGGRLEKRGEVCYQYDTIGNLIRKKEGSNEWKYKYYGNNLLKEVTSPEGKQVTFQYDGLGRRIRKFDGTKERRFLWDGDVLLHEWEVEAETSISSAPVTWIFEEQEFQPMAKITKEHSYSIVSDHLGTPMEMYDETGERVWSGEIDIYGRMRYQEGAAEMPFRFPGQYADEETGLYYNRFRYYAPEEGIYIQQDPIGLRSGVFNFYQYVTNPVFIYDPYGLDWAYQIEGYDAVTNMRKIIYTGHASGNATLKNVAKRHAGTKGADGARFGPGDTIYRRTPTDLKKSVTQGLEQIGIDDEGTMIGRKTKNKRGNNILGISEKNQKKKVGIKKMDEGRGFLDGKKVNKVSDLTPKETLTFEDFNHS